MNIDIAWLIVAGISVGAGIALWYILRDNDTWEPAGVKVEQEERRRTENQAYREMVERATKEMPLFRRQADILDDDKNRDPRSVI